MPIYLYHCAKCRDTIETLQYGINPPICCDETMEYIFAPIAIIKMSGYNGVRIHSKGYKEGYAKDYGKDVPTPWNS